MRKILATPSQQLGKKDMKLQNQVNLEIRWSGSSGKATHTHTQRADIAPSAKQNQRHSLPFLYGKFSLFSYTDALQFTRHPSSPLEVLFLLITSLSLILCIYIKNM